jgi:hypothetical protein
MPQSKIQRPLFYDIETVGVPNGLKPDLGRIIVFGYRFEGDKKAHSILIDEKSLKKFDDRKLLEQLYPIFEQASIAIGHFSSVFDRRFINGRLLVLGMPPLPPVVMTDTVFVARRAACFSSNRLGYLSEILQLDNRKQSKGWPTWWYQTMRGDMTALRKIAKYCRADVDATRDLYHRLRPFDIKHPRIVEDREKCRVCGGDVEYRGYALVASKRYRRFVCTSDGCRKWDRSFQEVKS